MSVTYNRINFINRVVERPRTYTVTNNGDGTVTLTPEPGEIVSEGVPFNAQNMNVLDKGVNDCAVAINEMGGDITELQGRVKSFTATIPATGWTSQSSGAYYTINVSLSGILATDKPDIGIVQTGTWATDEAIRDAWACVTRIVAAANQLQITANAIPAVAIPIQVRCIR